MSVKRLVESGTVVMGVVLAVLLASAAAQPPASPPAAESPPPAAILKAHPPPDAPWTADAGLDEARAFTDPGLGAAQGVVVRDGKVYAYGDVYTATPRCGVIREYDLEFRPTGRAVWLRRGGKPLIIHPTGLTWDERWGTFLGDAVLKKSMIYRIDWEAAWRDGSLDRAVRDVIEDDAAVNGGRPTFVDLDGRVFLATADYGDVRPELRLCDPEALLAARRTSQPGVIIHRVLCGPFNQNLHWDRATRRLTFVQNVVEGRGWRLDVLDLPRAVSDGRAWGPGVRVALSTFAPHNELEGYWPLDAGRAVLVTSSRRDNLVVGRLRPASPHLSPPGEMSWGPVGKAPAR